MRSLGGQNRKTFHTQGAVVIASNKIHRELTFLCFLGDIVAAHFATRSWPFALFRSCEKVELLIDHGEALPEGVHSRSSYA